MGWGTIQSFALSATSYLPLLPRYCVKNLGLYYLLLGKSAVLYVQLYIWEKVKTKTKCFMGEGTFANVQLQNTLYPLQNVF